MLPEKISQNAHEQVSRHPGSLWVSPFPAPGQAGLLEDCAYAAESSGYRC